MDGISTGSIGYEDLLPLVEEKKLYLIDVREPNELKETGWIPTAINIPLNEFGEAFKMPELQFKAKYQADKPSLDASNIVVYCRSGRRVQSALEQVADSGYKMTMYSGSMLDWLAHNGPLQKEK